MAIGQRGGGAGDRGDAVWTAWSGQSEERGRASIGAGRGGREVSGREGEVGVVCASGTWGQWVRVRGLFFYC